MSRMSYRDDVGHLEALLRKLWYQVIQTSRDHDPEPLQQHKAFLWQCHKSIPMPSPHPTCSCRNKQKANQPIVFQRMHDDLAPQPYTYGSIESILHADMKSPQY